MLPCIIRSNCIEMYKGTDQQNPSIYKQITQKDSCNKMVRQSKKCGPLESNGTGISWNPAQKKETTWIGHTLRKPRDNIAQRSLQWNPQGQRKRGRPKNTWRRGVAQEMKEAGSPKQPAVDDLLLITHQWFYLNYLLGFIEHLYLTSFI